LSESRAAEVEHAPTFPDFLKQRQIIFFYFSFFNFLTFLCFQKE
jgi:hypothetical protein